MQAQTEITIRLADETATQALGSRLAALLPDGAAVALNGPLGAGKTRLVQGLAAAVGIDPETVLSPTFTLVHQYPFARGGEPRTLFHLDAYRVRGLEEFWELGVEEMFDSPNWTVIEWAERVAAALPEEYLEITLAVTSATERTATIRAVGAKWDEALKQIRRRG